MYNNDWVFVVVLNNGIVVTLGEPKEGGDITSVQSLLNHNVKDICSTKSAFAAVLQNGSIVTWGHRTYGGIIYEKEKKKKTR